MAEGGYDPRFNNRRKNQLCRYFMHGACRRGNNCDFVHSRDGTAPLNNICKFYQHGHCSYGKNCRYDHVKPSNSSPQSFRNDKENWSDRPHHGNMDRTSNMVVLKKEGVEKSIADAAEKSRQQAFQEKWVKAVDFVPGQRFHNNKTYASTTKSELEQEEDFALKFPDPEPTEKGLLCPFYAHGNCPYQDECKYLHGDVCDICNKSRLHPTDEKLREVHRKECLEEMEENMELSFAFHESKDKECCICLEMVMEKAKSTKSDARFGILENCNHCFCLSCIRKWRGEKSLGKNVRTCPICRILSNFVTPSKFWVEDEEKKKKLIQDYKDVLRSKPCQYFKEGKGECPFNEKCFYRHAYPDGTIAEPKPRKKRRRINADGDESLVDVLNLWSFLEHHDDEELLLADELSMLMSLVLIQNSDDEFNAQRSFSDTDSSSEWDL